MAQLDIRLLRSGDSDFETGLRDLLRRDRSEADVEQAVAETIARVRADGDRAVLDYTRRFDDVDPGSVAELELSPPDFEQALTAIDADQRDALEHAADRIRDYHRRQRQESWDYVEADGTRLGQKLTPVNSAGIYVPGGKANYPSSVLMNAIPARVAGVSEVIMAVPAPGGELNELVLAAAHLAGVDRGFKIGGAQAIAALAYGTETIPAVDKIVGPGNVYVAAAKRQVFGQVGIDMLAGPSEVLVVCDGSVDPKWVAMDLFAQAEHDELAQSIMLTTDERVAESVLEAIASLLPTMERAEVIARSLNDHGALIVAADRQEVISIIDRVAPEHLELLTADAADLADRVCNAGAIFVGPYSAESLGDYCAGPSHVLPTSGTARFSSPLGVSDFQKRSSIIHCSPEGARAMARSASVLARAEGLTAHARSAEYRLGNRETD